MQMLRNHKSLVQTYSMVPRQQALLQPGCLSILQESGFLLSYILFASCIDLTAGI